MTIKRVDETGESASEIVTLGQMRRDGDKLVIDYTHDGQSFTVTINHPSRI